MLDGISALQGYTSGDKTPFFENNLAAAIAARRPLFIPAGDHVLTRGLLYQGASPITIYGSGKNNSRIIWDANAQSEGITLRSTSDRGGVEAEGFSLISRKASTGVALNLGFGQQAVPIGTSGDTLIVDRFKPRAHLHDIIMGGDENIDAYGWNIGVSVFQPLQVRLSDLTFIGQRNGAHDFRSGTAFQLGNGNNNLGHPVESYVDRCAAYNVQNGVIFQGMEGMFARGNHFVDVDAAMQFLDTTGRPHVECVGNHMNMNQFGIRCDGVREVRLDGNSIYHRVNTPKAGVAIGVGGPGAANCQITDNFIVNNIDTTGQLSAVDIYKCDGGRIDGNQIIAQVPGRGRQGKGITLAGDARYIIVGRDNVFPEAGLGRQTLQGQNVSNFGQNNIIRT